MEIKGSVQEFKEFMKIFQLKEEKATPDETSIANKVLKEMTQYAIENCSKSISIERAKELKKIVQPTIDFIKKYYNPHTTIIVSEDSIKVVSDEINIPIRYN